MNIVFLFLTRDDLNAIPRIREWLTGHPGPHTVLAFVNPHLAIDPSPAQLDLEAKIAGTMISSSETASGERITLELELQKRWMQIPREVMIAQLETLFRPFGITTKTGLTILNESFQGDRLPELLTKLRPAWPAAIPAGSFMLVFPNQIPVAKASVAIVPSEKVVPAPVSVATVAVVESPKKPGRKKGSITDPAKRQAMLDRLALARKVRQENADKRKLAPAA